MWIYLKYIVVWLFFMALIVGITLLVPKLAARIDKMRQQKPEQQDQPNQNQPNLTQPNPDENTPTD